MFLNALRPKAHAGRKLQGADPASALAGNTGLGCGYRTRIAHRALEIDRHVRRSPRCHDGGNEDTNPNEETPEILSPVFTTPNAHRRAVYRLGPEKELFEPR